MGLDMYLEGSFSKRAYVQPTAQQYTDMREGKEVTVEKSQALIDALEATGLQNAPDTVIEYVVMKRFEDLSQ